MHRNKMITKLKLTSNISFSADGWDFVEVTISDIPMDPTESSAGMLKANYNMQKDDNSDI